MAPTVLHALMSTKIFFRMFLLFLLFPSILRVPLMTRTFFCLRFGRTLFPLGVLQSFSDLGGVKCTPAFSSSCILLVSGPFRVRAALLRRCLCRVYNPLLALHLLRGNFDII